MRPRRRQALFSAGLLVFLVFCLSAVAALRMVPRELRLFPGEMGRLRVNFPLSLFVSEEGRSFLAGPARRGSELTFKAAAAGAFSVELKLLGALPLGRVAVRIMEPREVMAGGQAIGVLLSAEGVVVVGHRPLQTLEGAKRYPAREAGIEVGDVLLRADGAVIMHADDLTRLVERAAAEERPLRLYLKRAGRFLEKEIEPAVCRWPENGESRPRAMLGLFVEDPAAGVGTLSFYDPKSGAFAALGHRISELGGQHRVWLEGGKIVTARIAGIEQGRRGEPGEKIGTFAGPEDIIGTIESNSRFGLFGRLHAPLEGGRLVPVALAHQVHTGPAKMLTVVRDTEIGEFDVEIVRVYPQSEPRDRGLVVRITDERLLAAAGGIVQGMSGSPILQDGLLVGAVTHVFVNDPTRGYGVLAEWMLQEMDATLGGPAEDREELPAA